MRHNFAIYLLCVMAGLGQHWKANANPYNFETSPLLPKAKEHLRQGRGAVINVAVNSTPAKQQAMEVLASDLHQRSCNWAMRKLSQYESYPQFIDFIKKSSYQESTQQLYFSMDSAWMPFRMMLLFYIPRIKKAGQYAFEFRDGFLKGLKGEIHLSDEQIGGHKRCLFTVLAHWQGEPSPLPDFALETLVKTILQVGMEKLFRISQ